jgi:quinoprotein glucose dehydrogenase
MKIYHIKAMTLLLYVVSLFSCKENEVKSYETWPVYNGSKEGIKYSSLTQIDTNNVSKLKVAWQYNSGDADTLNYSQIQCNPIIVDSILYGVNPLMKLFAIDASNGKQKWVFDVKKFIEHSAKKSNFHNMINSRGVAYWTDGKADKRIFFTAGSHTYAIDANSGVPISSFGDEGSIDLHEGLDRDSVEDQFIVNNSPGIVYKDMIILGSRVDETMPAAPGHIRAYDARTGKRKWIFHTIPHPGEYGYETWEDKNAYKYFGGVNCWSGFTLDEKNGVLFVPLGSASSDFYGGKRKGNTLYANCLLALDANTGKRIWHYQTMHHDVWDKDLPAAPVLVTLNKDGKKIDAVAQITKNGYIYIFERKNGKPIYNINEIPVDTISMLDGEKLWATQPYPTIPEPFARQYFSDKEINPYITLNEKNEIIKKLKDYKYGRKFIPPGTGTSVLMPGYDGGGEWGGPSYDPFTGIMYVNSNEMAWLQKMVPNTIESNKINENWKDAGTRLFIKNCAACHGTDRKGTGNSPSLISINKKYDATTLKNLINSGRSMMPSFKRLDDEEKDAIVAYITENKESYKKKFNYVSHVDMRTHMPYKIEGYTKFLTKDGYPVVAPPWGTLNAINLNTGQYIWKIPFGEYPELLKKGIKNTGSENYGGSVVTAGGLLFIGATRDNKIRAYNKKTGKLLWEYLLPGSAFATPAIYNLNGKQYLVIACGGGKLKTRSSDAYVAFCL